MVEPSITHIAGADVSIGGRRVRQRCSWCGAILLDYDLASMAVAMPDTGEDPESPGTWPIGRLVRVTGTNPRVTTVLDESDTLPDDACGRIDDAVTSQ